MPRKLICVEPGKLEWQERALPELGPGQVRVRVEHAAAKHGTEMAWFKGYRDDVMSWPAAVGNMIVGRVSEVGAEATPLAIGDRVCAYSGFTDVWTGDAAACWTLPEGMPWQSAVCLDPADFAFAAVRDGHARIGDAAVIFGLGAIGLMGVQLLKLAGADPVVAVDPLPNRRAIAEQLGATVALDPTACDVAGELKRLTAGRGADVAIDYSGSVPALNDAIRSVAYGGTVVCGAFPPPYGAGVDFGSDAHLRIPNIVFSRACSEPFRDHPRWNERLVWDVCWKWFIQGRLTGEPIVQPVVPIDGLLTQYPRIATEPNDFVKLGAEL